MDIVVEIQTTTTIINRLFNLKARSSHLIFGGLCAFVVNEQLNTLKIKFLCLSRVEAVPVRWVASFFCNPINHLLGKIYRGERVFEEKSSIFLQKHAHPKKWLRPPFSRSEKGGRV
jgi:hypothetical protein